MQNNKFKFLNFNVALVGLLAFTMISCKDLVPPCMPCTEAGLGGCKEIDTKLDVYCDEPTATTEKQGNTELTIVNAGVCRDHTGSEFSDYAPKLENSSLFARGPQICNPNNAGIVDAELEQFLYDYRKLVGENACSTSTTNFCKNVNWLREAHNAAVGNLASFGVTGPSNEVMLISDMSVLFKNYRSKENFSKILAPRNFKCLAGPVRGFKDDAFTIDTKKNKYGCATGVMTLYGATDGAGSSAFAGGGILGIFAQITGINPVSGTAPELATNQAQTAGSAANMMASKIVGSGGFNSGGGSGSGSGLTGGNTQSGIPVATADGAGTGGSGSGSGGFNSGLSDSSGDAAPIAKNGDEDGAANKNSNLEYSTAGGGSGSARKGNDSGGFGSLAGLFGSKGAADGVAGGGVSKATFGKQGAAAGAAGGSLSDNQVEDYLKANSNSSLFDIVNRRYFRWGGTVSQERH